MLYIQLSELKVQYILTMPVTLKAVPFVAPTQNREHPEVLGTSHNPGGERAQVHWIRQQL